MIDNALKLRLKSLPLAAAVRAGDSVFTSEHRDAIDKAYFALFGNVVKKCRCKHRYADAAIEIINALKLKTDTTMKYELKAGRLIWVNNNPYSNANLTDKIAKKWCEQHPEEVDKFFQRHDEKKIVDNPILED